MGHPDCRNAPHVAVRNSTGSCGSKGSARYRPSHTLHFTTILSMSFGVMPNSVGTSIEGKPARLAPWEGAVLLEEESLFYVGIRLFTCRFFQARGLVSRPAVQQERALGSWFQKPPEAECLGHASRAGRTFTVLGESVTIACTFGLKVGGSCITTQDQHCIQLEKLGQP